MKSQDRETAVKIEKLAKELDVTLKTVMGTSFFRPVSLTLSVLDNELEQLVEYIGDYLPAEVKSDVAETVPMVEKKVADLTHAELFERYTTLANACSGVVENTRFDSQECYCDVDGLNGGCGVCTLIRETRLFKRTRY